MSEKRWILVRHAPASPRDFARWPDDRGRPLRPAGRKEFQAAAVGISSLLSSPGQIVTSPLKRAVETAEILAGAWKGSRVQAEWPELEPEGFAGAVFIKARQVRGSGDLVLVGHEPQLSRFVGYCLSGEEFSAVRFSKGGAIAIDFPGAIRPGGGRIQWALTRGLARRLRTSKGKTSDDE